MSPCMLACIGYIHSQISATADQPGTATTLPPPTASAGEAPRPKTISSFGSSSAEVKKDPSKAAKYIIRDLSGVGKDLRPRPPPRSTGFMKPEGVDLPVGRAIKKEEDRPRKAKQKRVRDPGGGDGGSGGHGRPTADSGAVEKKPKLEMIE